MQLFERQTIEDGDLSTRVWAADLSPPPKDGEDPDNDDNIPIPWVKSKGKDSDHIPVVRVSDDEEDDDSHILEPLDPMPISWHLLLFQPRWMLGQVRLGSGQPSPRQTQPRPAREPRG